MASESYTKVKSGYAVAETDNPVFFIPCGFIPKMCFILNGGYGVDLIWINTMPEGFVFFRDFLGTATQTSGGPKPILVKQKNGMGEWGLSFGPIPGFVLYAGEQINFTIMG